nr:transporter substrate-binding domain-containing protein [uncultured Lichenicoccus sp.]
MAALLVGAAILLSAPAGAAPRTIDTVRNTGRLSCGIIVEQEDFTKSDSHGDLSGFAAPFCGAVAAAVLGDPRKVALKGYPDQGHALAALQGRQLDLLVGVTPDATTALLHHLGFAPAIFIDGQGFLVARRLHARAPADLAGHLVCYIAGTPADAGMLDWSARSHVALRHHPFEEIGEMEAALTSGNCDAITAGVSWLAGMRAGFHAMQDQFEILPQMISVDPFAPAMRGDDAAWTAIVSDVVGALVDAEQDGVSRDRLGRLSGDPAATGALAAPTPGLVGLLGLQDGWAARAVAASGNYGQILAARAGAASPLRLARGPNALWSQGGLIDGVR